MSSVNPVNFKIPSGYEYKNVNITNFSGITESENLMDGNKTGCKYCENVYVNDQQVLAVRPRLDHVDVAFDGSHIVKINKISDKEIIYVTENSIIYFSDLNTLTNATIISKPKNIDIAEGSYFKNANGDIFYTCTSGLFKIDLKTQELKNALEEAYIPTTKIGMTVGDETSGQLTVESFNILTDKYKQTYNFD
jgi:hypothetical protein